VKILVIKLRSVGDVLLVTPLIKNLKLNNENSLIDVMVNANSLGKNTVEILSYNKSINSVIPYTGKVNKSMHLFRRIKSEIGVLTKLIKTKYDIVINLDLGERGAYISFLSGARIRVGLNNKPYINKIYNKHLKIKHQHTVDFNLQPLNILGLKIFTNAVEVFWSIDDNAYVVKKLKDHGIFDIHSFIHIHPSSLGVEKCIKNKLMAQIIDYCEFKLNLKVVLTAAPIKDEIDRIDNILDFCKSKPVNLSGTLTLLQTAALNKRAKLFIGVDTAIMHISAANDTPVFAFFGPSAIDVWGPWNNNAIGYKYYRTGGFQKIGKHRVYAEQRDCLPCGKNGCNHSLVSDCLMSLDVDFINKRIKDMVSENLNIKI